MIMLIRSLAGLIGGYLLGIALAGLWTHWGGSDAERNLSFAMLFIVPVWIGALALVFAARSTWYACIALLAANAVCYSILWALPAIAIVGPP
jgi:hypothetical protein